MLPPFDVTPLLSNAFRYSSATDLRCSSVIVCRVIAMRSSEGAQDTPVLGTWALVLGRSPVLGPSLVHGPSFVLGPWSWHQSCPSATHGSVPIRGPARVAGRETAMRSCRGAAASAGISRAQFLRYAFASNGKLKSGYYAAEGRKYLAADETAQLIALNESVARMLRRWQATL